MNIPQIQISQTHAQISMKQDYGEVEIRQPKAHMEMKSGLPPLQIVRIEDKLEIDQSKAWAAYGLMGLLETRDRIYNQVKELANLYIAKTAQKGDQLAAIHRSTDVIPELAKNTAVSFPELDYVGEASIDNVDIYYQPGDLHFHSERATIDLQVIPQKPIIQHKQAQVHISMERYPKIEIHVPGRRVDLSL